MTAGAAHQQQQESCLLSLSSDSDVLADAHSDSWGAHQPSAAVVTLLNCSPLCSNFLAPACAQDFVSCCDKILPFFDHLGPVFHVARGEFQGKLETLRAQADSKPLLQDIVAADKAANVATVKNSCTRNLHRLTSAIRFVQLLFQKLVSASKPAADGGAAAAAETVTLREAAGSAYEEALAPIHTTIVRGVVRAGMMTLPSREHFMASIGETEETALPRAEEVIAASVAVHSSVMRLFDDIEMPSSSTWFWPG